MESNTSGSFAAGTIPAIVDQGLSSAHAQSLLPPPSFVPHPPPGASLVPASSSGSGSPAAGDGFFSVHGHATSQSLHLSSFSFPPVHMTGGDVFAHPEAPAAAHVPTALGGHPWEGNAQPSSSWTASGLPALPTAADGFSGFAGQSPALEQMAAWQSEMSSSLFSPPSGSDPPPRISGSGVGSAAQTSSDYELAPLPESLRIPPPEEASMYNTIGDGESLPWNRGDSFMDVGSSISSGPDLTTGAMAAPPTLPLTPPSSQGACASTNFTGFPQPPSNSDELAPFPANLQPPLLPVKQEPIDAIATRRDPEFISLIDDEEPEQDQYAMPHSIPDAENNLPVSDTSTANASTVVAGSSSMDIISSTAKLSIGGKNSPRLLHLPPSPLRVGASSRGSYYTRIMFTDAEKEIINKEKNLQELLNTDPKKLKRILSSRAYSARRKVIRDTQTLELERKIETMQVNCNTLRGHLQFLQGQCAELEAEEKEMVMMVQEREQQSMLKDAVCESLQDHLKTLNIMKLKNGLQWSPAIHGTSVWGAHGLHQQTGTKIADGSSSQMNVLHQQISPHMVRLQQLQIQEQPSEHQQAQARNMH